MIPVISMPVCGYAALLAQSNEYEVTVVEDADQSIVLNSP